MGRRIKNALSSLRFWHREVIPYVPRPWQTGGLLSLPDDVLLYILDVAYPDDRNSRITLAMRLADVHPAFRLRFSRMFRHCVSPRGENWGSISDVARAVIQFFDQLLQQPQSTLCRRAMMARTRTQMRAIRLFRDHCACSFYYDRRTGGHYEVPGYYGYGRYLVYTVRLEVFLITLEDEDLSMVHIHDEVVTAFTSQADWKCRPYIRPPDMAVEGTL